MNLMESDEYTKRSSENWGKISAFRGEGVRFVPVLVQIIKKLDRHSTFILSTSEHCKTEYNFFSSKKVEESQLNHQELGLALHNLVSAGDKWWVMGPRSRARDKSREGPAGLAVFSGNAALIDTCCTGCFVKKQPLLLSSISPKKMIKFEQTW